MNISRRKLIFGTLGTAALLPAAYVVRHSVGAYEYPKSYSHLNKKEAVIIAALAEAVIGDNNVFGISPESVDTVGAVNDFVSIGSTLEQTEMRILFWTTEHILPILGGYFKKFSDLKIESRIALINRLDQKNRGIPKLIARAMKTVICFGYFNTPKLQEYLGVKGWCGP